MESCIVVDVPKLGKVEKVKNSMGRINRHVHNNIRGGRVVIGVQLVEAKKGRGLTRIVNIQPGRETWTKARPCTLRLDRLCVCLPRRR